jgi:hypothetical protein
VYRQTGALIYANSSDSNETSSFVQERAKYLTMPDGKIKYHFVGMPWRHPSPGGWYFISLPPEISVEIRSLFKSEEQGWGRLRVTASIGKTEWQTAIWFDLKRETYLLPLKADVRKKESIGTGMEVDVVIRV